jgi:hypothetical protein
MTLRQFILAAAAVALGAVTLFPPLVEVTVVSFMPSDRPWDPYRVVTFTAERTEGHRFFLNRDAEERRSENMRSRQEVDWRALIAEYALVLSGTSVLLILARGRGNRQRP